MTSGAFSHQTEGTTTQSTSAIRLRQFSRRRARDTTTDGPAALDASSKAWRNGSGWKFMPPCRCAGAHRRLLGGQLPSGRERHQHALVRRDVAEEAEALRARRAAVPPAPALGRQAVGDDVDPGRRQAPGDVAVAQEGAGRDEPVDRAAACS